MAVIWDSTKYAENYSPLFDHRQASPRYGTMVSITENPRLYGSLLDGNTDFSLKHWANRLQNIGLKLSSFSQNDMILIVGCGFGYLIEAIKDVGGNNVFGTDTSAFVQNSLNNEDFVRSDIAPLIFNIDVTNQNAADLFKNSNAGNSQGKFVWVVSELVVESLNDSELINFLSGCDRLKAPGQSGVIHIFAGRLPNNYQDPEMYWRTGSELLSLASGAGYSNHVFIDIHGWVLYGG